MNNTHLDMEKPLIQMLGFVIIILTVSADIPTGKSNSIIY